MPDLKKKKKSLFPAGTLLTMTFLHVTIGFNRGCLPELA